jgi:hypothetical protein
MKSFGIQLRFRVIYNMSIGIQKSIDFERFFYGMDFVRLFSWKYKYYTLPTIPLKTLRLFILSSRLFFLLEIYYVLSMFLLRMRVKRKTEDLVLYNFLCLIGNRLFLSTIIDDFVIQIQIWLFKNQIDILFIVHRYTFRSILHYLFWMAIHYTQTWIV